MAFTEAHGRRAIGSAQVGVQLDGADASVGPPIVEEQRLAVRGERGQLGPLEPREVSLLRLPGTRHDEALVPLGHGDEGTAVGGDVVERDRPGHPGQDALLALRA